MGINIVDVEMNFKNEIIDKLVSIGFVDSSTLTEEEIESESLPIIWDYLLDNSAGSSKKVYIVYRLLPDSNNLFGDGENLIRQPQANLYLNTTYNPSSQECFTLRQNIENAFKDYPYKIVFNMSYFDEKTKLYEYSYTIHRMY